MTVNTRTDLFRTKKPSPRLHPRVSTKMPIMKGKVVFMKKIITLSVVVVFLLSIICTNCFAYENTTNNTDDDSSSSNSSIGPCGCLPASPEEIAAWRATHDEFAELARIYSSFVQEPTRATWYDASDFVYYGQEVCDSCGPASVRMALHSVTGTAPTEAAARVGCQWVSGYGTTMAHCCDYLNDEQSLYLYDAKYSILKTTFEYYVYNALCDEVPAIVGIVITENDGWYYDTTGHFITIQGVMSDKSKYKIADPWGGYANNSQCVQYEKNSDELWDAYHWAHGYIA